MFDFGRVLAIGWALFVVCRARAWLEAVILGVVAYLFALEVASGITLRAEGPQEPIVVVLPAIIGPTAMPRGHLSPLPLGAFVVQWPALVNVAAAAALILPARRLISRIDDLPQFSPETRRLGQVALALFLVAVLEGPGVDGSHASNRATSSPFARARPFITLDPRTASTEHARVMRSESISPSLNDAFKTPRSAASILLAVAGAKRSASLARRPLAAPMQGGGGATRVCTCGSFQPPGTDAGVTTFSGALQGESIRPSGWERRVTLSLGSDIRCGLPPDGVLTKPKELARHDECTPDRTCAALATDAPC